MRLSTGSSAGRLVRRCAYLLALGCMLTAIGSKPLISNAQGTLDDARPPTSEGLVTRIREEKTIEVQGLSQRYQLLEVQISDGAHAGETVTIESGSIASISVIRYEPGDRLLIESSPDMDGTERYYIVDRVRRKPLLLLFALFVAVTLLVARSRGLASILGMGLSFGVIFAYVLPQILAGRDPIAIALSAAMVVIPMTFSLSHGLNRKTAAAATGTVIALAITALLANAVVNAAQLTGYSSEEAGFLQMGQGGVLNMRGLLLASVIIGLLGILDDITVSQAAIVYQLHDASPGLSLREIYGRSMNVGRDHIASLVNTLILVYTSSAMPLLLIFVRDTNAIGTVINYEIVAEEIVRTLVASIGLIMAVPITTAVACLFIAQAAYSARPRPAGDG